MMISNRSMTLPLLTLTASLALLVGGCAGQQSAAQHADAATAPAADGAAVPVDSTAPIEADAATLTVKGLSCPQCASNIDRTLQRVAGVRFVAVDLAAGRVNLALGGKERPSPARLATAVAEAGFSIDSITVR